VTATLSLNGTYAKDNYLNSETTSITYAVVFTDGDITTYNNGEIRIEFEFNNSGSWNQVTGTSYESLGASPSSYSISMTYSQISNEMGTNAGTETSIKWRVKIRDAAVNAGNTITKPGSPAAHTIDITDPDLYSNTPDYYDNYNYSTVTYTLGEACASGTITVTGNDNSSQTYTMQASDLTQATHSNVDISGSVTLVNGVQYRYYYDFFDDAGNRAVEDERSQ